MKKMMTIAVALFVAVAANAATFAWSTLWTYSTNPNGIMNESLFNDGTSAGTAWLVMAGGGVGGISVDNLGNLTKGTGNFIYDTESITGPQFAFSADVPDTQNSNPFVLVAFDSATSMWGVSLAYTMDGLDDDPPVSGGATFQNDKGVNPDKGVYIPNTYLALNIQAVPEPTSFALLGLGAAAIALRRRIRKA